ncbi:unnamed protein product [Phytophthora lilii]|uniref:Unnamed protein product n=1 Tax=Phytophthora lilii TaxID=2077276 RepID=A0A9W6WU29_9STRA|nr:unnamed protein product [Phytophthora lilii]
MERQVWFQLRDVESDPFGSADYVDCAKDATIAQFRKVLKKECPNILARVDAPFLTVFENEATYKAKQALTEDSPISSFGGSKKYALIVEVPTRSKTTGLDSSQDLPAVIHWVVTQRPEVVVQNEDQLLELSSACINGTGLAVRGREHGARYTSILNGMSRERRVIVFLDGYVKSSKAGEAARLQCKRWHQDDKTNRRLVCVCSLATPGRAYRPEAYKPIPTLVDTQGSTESEDVEMKIIAGSDDVEMSIVDEDVDGHMVAEMISVASVFPKSNNALEERQKLLETKYFVAGGNARLMFEEETERAIEILNFAIRRVHDVELYLHGHVGDASPSVVNCLLACYYTAEGSDIRVVSSYVVRKFAIIVGPRLLEKFAKICTVNPSMDGHILEIRFFSELKHKGLDWSYRAESTLKYDRWEQSEIFFFSPVKYYIEISLDKPIWMAPTMWNQGGYDAVFVNKRENLVRFVQVTRAKKHTFDPFFFVALLDKLAASGLTQISLVELYFVVPMARLETFSLPVSTQDFQRNVVQVASSEPSGTRSGVNQTFQNCKSNVMVIGVQYKITTRKPVEVTH